MTPEEKSKELIEKMYATGINGGDKAVQCAAICVQEIINDMGNEAMEHRVQYWQQVLSIIQNK